MLSLLIASLITPAFASTSTHFAAPINTACYQSCAAQAAQRHVNARACYSPCAENVQTISFPGDEGGGADSGKGHGGSDGSDHGDNGSGHENK